MSKILLVCACVGLLAGSALAQNPGITAVQDAGGYTDNVAQGSLFVVKGTNLSASGFVQSPVPYPATLNNVKVTFTPVGGGAGTQAFLYYTYNVGGVNQLAGVAPSTLAPGDYNVTVTNGNNTSAPFRTTVMARKPGIITQDSSGSGNVVVQNYIGTSCCDVNRLTTGTFAGTTLKYSPSHPGQIIVIWGTGLGKVSKPDSDAPGAIDLRNEAQIRVIVGGQTITPDLYAGRAPEFPGTDEIILTLPNNVPTGCTVSLQVSADGVMSNPATIAIAPAGATACVLPGYNEATLARLDAGGALTIGAFSLSSFAASIDVPGFGTASTKTESATGSFTKFTGAQLASAGAVTGIVTNACQVFHRIGGGPQDFVYGGSATNLDAGAAITLAGPNITAANNQLVRQTGNIYNDSLGTAISVPGVNFPIPGYNANPVISSGTYTLTGTGGADVGAFTAKVTVGSPLAVGTLPSTVNRSSGLSVTWTGGAATDIVNITGYSGVTVGGTPSAPIYDSAVFVCTTTADRGRFDVPSSVLLQLPATPAAAADGTGALVVISSSQPTANSGLFSAPLVAGGNIDTGVFLSSSGTFKTMQYQ